MLLPFQARISLARLYFTITDTDKDTDTDTDLIGCRLEDGGYNSTPFEL